MKYVIVQPANAFYLWQYQVQLYNFTQLGIEKDLIAIFTHPPDYISHPVVEFIADRPNVFFIPDTRKDSHYPPNTRQHALAKFFAEHEINEPWMYLDVDVIFTRPLSIPVSENVLGSECRWYLGANYIESKGKGLLEEMCEVVGIDPGFVRLNEHRCTGAQLVFPKSPSPPFWSKVESDSVRLYDLMRRTEPKYNPASPIQSWTADMWALLWNLWLHDFNTEVLPELEFSMATDKIEDLKGIYHNAGVVDQKQLFNKNRFKTSSPFDGVPSVSEEFCSARYVEEILNTKEWLKSL